MRPQQLSQARELERPWEGGGRGGSLRCAGHSRWMLSEFTLVCAGAVGPPGSEGQQVISRAVPRFAQAPLHHILYF